MTHPNIYVNGFWNGFIDKTDANHIEFFEKIFIKVFGYYEMTDNINDATVLFESVFSQSLINYKKWDLTIHYSGEPRKNNLSYDIILYSDKDNIDIPLFVYYIHGNNFLEKLIYRPIVTSVPKKFCCFIVSNGNCEVRNKMFHLINQYKKVDSYGRFENNMDEIIEYNYWSKEFHEFISNYKFIICFENSKFGTYSTEKIINPYLSGIIPIYWSTHHIHNVFNKDSMIFLENETDEDYVKVLNQIIELDNDDPKYLEYVNRPCIKTDYWEENYTIDKISEKIKNRN